MERLQAIKAMLANLSDEDRAETLTLSEKLIKIVKENGYVGLLAIAVVYESFAAAMRFMEEKTV